MYLNNLKKNHCTNIRVRGLVDSFSMVYGGVTRYLVK